MNDFGDITVTFFFWAMTVNRLLISPRRDDGVLMTKFARSGSIDEAGIFVFSCSAFLWKIAHNLNGLQA